MSNSEQHTPLNVQYRVSRRLLETGEGPVQHRGARLLSDINGWFPSHRSTLLLPLRRAVLGTVDTSSCPCRDQRCPRAGNRWDVGHRWASDPSPGTSKVLISLLRHFCGKQLFFMSFTLPLDLFSLFLTPPVSCASNGSPNAPVAVTTESQNVRG